MPSDGRSKDALTCLHSAFFALSVAAAAFKLKSFIVETGLLPAMSLDQSRVVMCSASNKPFFVLGLI